MQWHILVNINIQKPFPHKYSLCNNANLPLGLPFVFNFVFLRKPFAWEFGPALFSRNPSTLNHHPIWIGKALHLRSFLVRCDALDLLDFDFEVDFPWCSWVSWKDLCWKQVVHFLRAATSHTRAHTHTPRFTRIRTHSKRRMPTFCCLRLQFFSHSVWIDLFVQCVRGSIVLKIWQRLHQRVARLFGCVSWKLKAYHCQPYHPNISRLFWHCSMWNSYTTTAYLCCVGYYEYLS